MTNYQEDRTTMETQHLVTLQATSPAVLKPGLTRARYVEHMAKSFRGKATRLYFAIPKTGRHNPRNNAKSPITQC